MQYFLQVLAKQQQKETKNLLKRYIFDLTLHSNTLEKNIWYHIYIKKMHCK